MATADQRWPKDARTCAGGRARWSLWPRWEDAQVFLGMWPVGPGDCSFPSQTIPRSVLCAELPLGPRGRCRRCYDASVTSLGIANKNRCETAVRFRVVVDAPRDARSPHVLLAGAPQGTPGTAVGRATCGISTISGDPAGTIHRCTRVKGPPDLGVTVAGGESQATQAHVPSQALWVGETEARGVQAAPGGGCSARENSPTSPPSSSLPGPPEGASLPSQA